MRTVSRIALVLVIIGAINWGLIGLFQYDLVAAIFGGQNALLSRVIYTLVGISGLVCLPILFETDEEEVADRRQTFRNPNYGTEFGEEPDFTEVTKEKVTTKKAYDPKSNHNSNNKNNRNNRR